MKLLENLSGWFADLQPRERLIMTIGAVLLVIAAIYMALLPAMQKNAELEQRYQSLNDDMQWLREQKEVITRIIRRGQLKLLGLNQDDLTFFSFTVSGTSPNRILQMIHQLTCQGLALEFLDIRISTGEKVGYVADIEVINVD